MLQQQPDRFEVALFDGFVQRAVAVLASSLDVRSRLEQRSDDRKVSAHGGHM